MPKNSSASRRTKVRAVAAEHGISYVAAHAKLADGSARATRDVDSTATVDRGPAPWESELIEEIVWFGNELNLYPNPRIHAVPSVQHKLMQHIYRIGKTSHPDLVAAAIRWSTRVC